MLEESKKAGLPLQENWKALIWPGFSPNYEAVKNNEFEKLIWRFQGKQRRELTEGCHVHQSALDWAKHHDERLPLPDRYQTVLQ